MNASDVISVLRNNVEDAKEIGTSTVPIHLLQKLVEDLEHLNAITPTEVSNSDQALEWYRAKLADRNARWNARREVNNTMVNLTVTTGFNALKAGTLINGGAAVATMALLGSLYQSKSEVMAGRMIAPLACFAGGIFLSGVATGATYLSQGCFGGEFGSKRWGVRWRFVAIAAAALALFSFPLGAGWFSAAYL